MKKWFSSNIRAMAVILALCVSMHGAAQEKEPPNFFGKIKDFTIKTVDFVAYVLSDIDTAYVENNLYNLTFMPEYSFSYEHYRIGTMGETGQSIGIVPDRRNVMSLNFGWRWIIVGYSIDLQKNRPLKEFTTSLYSTRFGLDLLYREASEGYGINDVQGLHNGRPLPDNLAGKDVLDVKQLGVGLHYAFNKRFSYSAAYGQSTIQRVSAGSLILGAGYNWQEFAFNYDNIESHTGAVLQEKLKYDKAVYNDFNISLGYAYNWAFAKNFLVGASFEPAIGYKQARLQYKEENKLQGSIGVDFTTRAALVYNNQRFYAGASLESHTYLFHKKPLFMTNGFGVLEVYVGVNFWRRK